MVRPFWLKKCERLIISRASATISSLSAFLRSILSFSFFNIYLSCNVGWLFMQWHLIALQCFYYATMFLRYFIASIGETCRASQFPTNILDIKSNFCSIPLFSSMPNLAKLNLDLSKFS